MGSKDVGTALEASGRAWAIVFVVVGGLLLAATAFALFSPELEGAWSMIRCGGFFGCLFLGAGVRQLRFGLRSQ